MNKIGKYLKQTGRAFSFKNETVRKISAAQLVEIDETEIYEPVGTKLTKLVSNGFEQRHVGPGAGEQRAMLGALGLNTLDDLMNLTVPEQIRMRKALDIDDAITEADMREQFEKIAKMNQGVKSFLGMGYHNCVTPAPILRDVLLNPGWHTQYSPYQAEISQGRLQSLLNFQTMVCDLTGLAVANSSLLDESTAACEAITLMLNAGRNKRTRIIVDEKTHPQTLSCIKTRGQFHNLDTIICSKDEMQYHLNGNTAGVVVQYPDTEGSIVKLDELTRMTHECGGLVSVGTDLLALSLIQSPGDFGADVAFGSSQRLGIPMFLGGPAAAFFAAKKEYSRLVPGRIVGVSKDAQGKPALRLSLQAREQHIRREKATSNVCTAQALLANATAMWGVYHGAEGLTEVADSIHHATLVLAHGAHLAGHRVLNSAFFDTLKIDVGYDKNYILENAERKGINIRDYEGENCIGIALDETVTSHDLNNLLYILGSPKLVDGLNEMDIDQCEQSLIGNTEHARTSPFMQHEVFKKVRSELELVRYIKELERTDLSMVHSMIPLGSCTMKLNAASELEYLAMPEFQNSHPFAPQYQNRGWTMIFDELEKDLARITGYDKVSLQPNSGAQGEFAGLAAITAYHKFHHDHDRKICLIPTSAHGTNPASAKMAGLDVRAIKVNSDGSINMDSLKKELAKWGGKVSSIMVTYPSTFGVFDEDISELCGLVHDVGGQVYLDGANMNAQMGLAQPGKYGSDVSHLNLHKTFAIPHGGGGPGAGPIGVRSHLAPFLPSHPVHPGMNHKTSLGTISAAPYGNAGVLPISWAMIKMLGRDGLKKSSEVAILNANYMRKRLEESYKILFTGKHGMCAHEFIIDCRPFKKTAGVEAVDIAKRLMDYGYHAPTMSWPVPNTLMIEPTESESKAELDRYCEALIHIRNEIAQIESGKMSRTDNMLKNAPHTMDVSLGNEWSHPYSRMEATFPARWQTNANKFWPSVSRLDDSFGDKNLVCSCPPMESYQK